MTSCCWLTLATLVSLTQQTVQPPPPADPPQTSQSPPEQLDLPVSIERIQKALSTPPALKVNGDLPTFRVEVFGRTPSIKDFIGTDVFKGPVPRGSSAHQEFLAMVTPDEFRGYAVFTNKEGITVAVSSFGNAMLMEAAQLGIRKVQSFVKARQKEAARQEVAAALAALARARKEAGLPPK
jgi:hypothetical protein